MTQHRELSTIAAEIRATWRPVHYTAAPYLDAMSQLSTLDDNYYADDARSVVLYFLSNASTWRGPDARRIKVELNNMLRATRNEE